MWRAALWGAVVLYGLACVLGLRDLSRRGNVSPLRARALFSMGTGAAATALVWRALASAGRPVLGDEVGALVWLAIASSALVLAAEHLSRGRLVTPAAAPVMVVLMVGALVVPGTTGEPSPLLRGIWFRTHVTTALSGYAAFTVAFLSSALYTLQERAVRGKVWSVIGRRLPALQSLTALNRLMILMGFPIFTLALAMGIAWACITGTWGWQWLRDPKIIVALLTWAFYGGTFLLHLRGQAEGRRGAYLSLAGFSLVVFGFLTTTLLLTRIHRF